MNHLWFRPAQRPIISHGLALQKWRDFLIVIDTSGGSNDQPDEPDTLLAQTAIMPKPFEDGQCPERT